MLSNVNLVRSEPCAHYEEDGGGSMRGRGTVGEMRIHRAVRRSCRFEPISL